jgi:TIR domain
MATKDLFISHISEEAEVASMLTTMLREDFADLMGCFSSSDIGNIGAGDNWLTAIERALTQAKVVIVLCSKASVNRPWVQFEVGAAWMKGVPIIPVCHSGMTVSDLQMPLSLRQGVELGSEQGLVKLYDGLGRALRIDQAPRPANLPRRLDCIKQIEDRFRAKQVHQFELFIDVVLPPPGRLESDTIPDNAVVESNDASLRLFGYLNGNKRTWGDVVRAARKTPDTRWLRQLQHCIHLAGNDEGFRPVQAVYHTESGSYQPQLSKKEVDADGTTRYHVHLVETVVAPLSEVQNDFGLLATMLRLGLRFRYEVIERFQRATRAARGKPGVQPPPGELLANLRSAIEIIENDALSRGAEKMDRDAVMGLFDNDADRDVMAEVQDSWDDVRALMFRHEPASEAEVIDGLKRMRELNFQFMKLGTRRYHEMVCARWDNAERSGVDKNPVLSPTAA